MTCVDTGITIQSQQTEVLCWAQLIYEVWTTKDYVAFPWECRQMRFNWIRRYHPRKPWYEEWDICSQWLIQLFRHHGACSSYRASLPVHRNAPDDVIKWKHFPRNWPFVRGIHRSRWIPHTKASDAELWCFSLICVWINGWVNNREAGDLRRDRGHYDVIVMSL